IPVLDGSAAFPRRNSTDVYRDYRGVSRPRVRRDESKAALHRGGVRARRARCRIEGLQRRERSLAVTGRVYVFLLGAACVALIALALFTYPAADDFCFQERALRLGFLGAQADWYTT